MTLAAQLAAILTDARGDRSRRDLAGALGLSNTTLISLEQGKANPTLERVERMAEAYGVELELKVRPRRRKDPAAEAVEMLRNRP